MKFTRFILLLFFLSQSFIWSQEAQLNKAKEIDEQSTYPISAHKFLAKGEAKVEQFFKENPNYFEEIKLKKKAAWDFTVGSAKTWFAHNLTDGAGTDSYNVPSTCRAIGTNCYVFVEDDIWNTRITQDNVNAIKEAFDNSTPANANKGIYETVVGTFGDPPDVDGDPKIIILILDIKDGYDGSGGYVAGYFYSLNETTATNSNVAEIYYVDADPADLSTENGLSSALNTTAHEFQHMIHFNYHDGSDAKPSQTTFLNEGCSEISSVVCGYSLRNQTLYNNEYNHYLFDWRDGDDVLADYARASRYIVYLLDQFGVDVLKKLVQSTKTSIASIDDALSNLSTPTELRFTETLENWFMANVLNDKNINPAWGYTIPSVGTVNPLDHKNPNFDSPTIKVAISASDYISFSNGENLSIKFDDFGSGILKFKAIKYNNNNNSLEIEDISAGTQYTFSDFGTTFNKITFAVLNTNKSFKMSYSYSSTGEVDASNIVLAYDQNKPSGVLPLENNDTVSVYFDAVEGGRLDSIRVALRQAGSVHGGIYKFTGDPRPTPIGEPLLTDLTVTSNIAERPVYDTEAESYPIPFPNWITVDLTSHNIDVSDPFIAAFLVEGTYPENNRIMITDQPNTDNHSYSYFTPDNEENADWYTITSTSASAYAYLIRAYISTGVTDIEEQVVDVLPSTYNLEQNYPNPFNPSTNISFSLPNTSFVDLAVYNSLGEKVTSLVNKDLSAGSYSYDFDGAGLSSGIYYYKLVSGSFIETKKMILMK